VGPLRSATLYCATCQLSGFCSDSMASAMSPSVVAFGNARCGFDLVADAIVLGLAKASGFRFGPVDCHAVVLHRRVSAGEAEAMVLGTGGIHHALHCGRIRAGSDSRFRCAVEASHAVCGSRMALLVRLAALEAAAAGLETGGAKNGPCRLRLRNFGVCPSWMVCSGSSGRRPSQHSAVCPV